jgi:hypothetical protein
MAETMMLLAASVKGAFANTRLLWHAVAGWLVSSGEPFIPAPSWVAGFGIQSRDGPRRR